MNLAPEDESKPKSRRGRNNNPESNLQEAGKEEGLLASLRVYVRVTLTQDVWKGLTASAVVAAPTCKV